MSRMSTKSIDIDEGPVQDDSVRLRRSSSTIVPSLSGCSISDYEEHIAPRTTPGTSTPPQRTICKVVNSTLFKTRFSRQSSLTWGHKPSPLIGASCFLFLLPIPQLIRACCPISAFLLACVTVSSYLSDHVYTGLDSWAHFADRVLAPMAFTSNVYSIYHHYGAVWALSSLAALKCHLLANYYAKRGVFDKFVIWHSLWHAVGVGLILVCFAFNGTVGHNKEGGGSNIFHERFMM